MKSREVIFLDIYRDRIGENLRFSLREDHINVTVELLTIVKLLAEASMSIVIFVIWYFTFQRANKQSDQALEKHGELSERLLDLLEEEQEYKSLLAGTMNRLEILVKRTASCPLLTNPED